MAPLDHAMLSSRVFEAIANGVSLRKAAAAEGISHCVVLDWVRDDEALRNQYTRARELGYALLADEIITISDEIEFEPIPGPTPDSESTEVRVDATAVARNRLRVDSRKWILSKMLPKLYGDRTVLAGDPDAPLIPAAVHTMSDADLAAAIRADRAKRDSS